MELKDLTHGEHKADNVEALFLKVFNNKDGRLMLEYLERKKFVGNCDVVNSNRTFYELGKRDAIRMIKSQFDKIVSKVKNETKGK